jgi:arginine decarboxylase
VRPLVALSLPDADDLTMASRPVEGMTVGAPDTQSDAPLAAAVARFFDDPGASFTTPGHKRAEWLVDPLLALDLPLASGADDAQLSADYLGRAEALAAELWAADFCRFSVNGSTHGNQAFALAVGAPGDRVAVSRNLHKSLFAGLMLAGLEPVWMYPDVDPATGLPVGLGVQEVKRALAQDVRAVLLVEPSYVGVISDLDEIVSCAHAAGVPVIVDQAWGSHLGLHPELPRGAMHAGADGMVISAHKTLAAFTQSAIVLARGELLDFGRLDAAFELLNTTSPSAAIVASIDRARQLMATRGEEMLGRALTLARRFRRELSDVEGLSMLDERIVSTFEAAHNFDPLKLVLSLAGTGANGFEVEDDLSEDAVRVEMADRDVIVPLLTIGDDDASVDRLIAGLRRSIELRRSAPRAPASSAVWRVRPQTVMTPREAFFAPRERVDADEAIGRVSAETAAPYPPGIPALAPGELITRGMLDELRAEAAAGGRIAYCSDPTLSSMLVVR